MGVNAPARTVGDNSYFLELFLSVVFSVELDGRTWDLE